MASPLSSLSTLGKTQTHHYSAAMRLNLRRLSPHPLSTSLTRPYLRPGFSSSALSPPLRCFFRCRPPLSGPAFASSPIRSLSHRSSFVRHAATAAAPAVETQLEYMSSYSI